METSSLYGKEDNEGVLNEQTSGSCFSLICMYTHIQLHSGSFLLLLCMFCCLLLKSLSPFDFVFACKRSSKGEN